MEISKLGVILLFFQRRRFVQDLWVKNVWTFYAKNLGRGRIFEIFTNFSSVDFMYYPSTFIHNGKRILVFLSVISCRPLHNSFENEMCFPWFQQ